MAICAIVLCSACANRPGEFAPPEPVAVYVVLGEGGQAIARTIVSGNTCPDLVVDGAVQPMRMRVAPGAAPQRPGQATPSAFPVGVCEATLPSAVRTASVAGRSLPLAKTEAQRIVVLGDTGCRIKQSDKAFQNCSDPKAWPFQAVADAAAKEHADLVIHVGDYHYRETPCPAKIGCGNSPWGYGWDAWNADLFQPAERLFAAAPWVVARGNHEECARAGQGWFRMLDTRPFTPQRSCDTPENDADADFSEPYAVPLGGHWQLVVFDSAKASRPLDVSNPSDAHILAEYEKEMRTVAALAAAPGMQSVFVCHHPVLGFSTDKKSGTSFGNQALMSAMKPLNGTRYFPAGVEVALDGHVHIFEAIDFSSPQPATIVTGHGGDNLDSELPDPLPVALSSAAGVEVDFVAHSRSFGYLVMDRSPDGWILRAQRIDGSTLVVCTLTQKHLACARRGLLD